jgi:hypothetical protein
MNKPDLQTWAAGAEVLGSIAVVVSLLFVAFSINQNTVASRVAGLNDVYNTYREIELALAADSNWIELVIEGSSGARKLSAAETMRYDLYVSQHLNNWEVLIEDHERGFMPDDTFEGWDAFYARFAGKYVSAETWQRVKWATRMAPSKPGWNHSYDSSGPLTGPSRSRIAPSVIHSLVPSSARRRRRTPLSRERRFSSVWMISAPSHGETKPGGRFRRFIAAL